MTTIKATKAGIEYLLTENSELSLLQQINGDEVDISKQIKKASKLLELTNGGTKEVTTDLLEEVNFLIVNKLAIVVEPTSVTTNHLASVHKAVITEVKAEEYNPNGFAHKQVEIIPDEVLGDVPEELPTHIGGILLENALQQEENQNSQEDFKLEEYDPNGIPPPQPENINDQTEETNH